MTDRPIASRSSSDDAALNLVKRLALDSRTVLAEVTSGDKSFRCAISGSCALAGEEFTVKGMGFLTFELNSVSSCTFNEQQVVTTAADASIDWDIGLPFAALTLTNGARITFSHGLRPA